MDGIDRDPLFVALTRPQMFAGVTYAWFTVYAVLSAELFLIFRTAWVFAFAIMVHLAGMLLSLREPRFFDLWLVKVSRCPRVKNRAYWRLNSYRP